MNILDYLKIIPNAVPPKLIEILLNLPRNDLKPSLVSSRDGNNKINENYRITNSIEIPYEVNNIIHNGILDFYEVVLKYYFDQDLKKIEPTQFLMYNPGGKYDVHNDSEDFVDGNLIKLYPRDITVLAYLNEDYEGGELVFPDFGIKIKPKTGMVIAFPSYYEFQHQVLPVTKGQRFTLVTWIETFERIYDRPYELANNK